tara:strand:+ start:25590 stop:26399 length:810 start_codon:yes stop_codon:yes gene_type:complete
MIWNNIAFPVKEEWKDIQDFEGKYQISNYGRVKSLKRETPWVNRHRIEGVKKVRERILKPKTDKDGYKEVAMSHGNREYKHRRVHRLVALHFLVDTPDENSCLVIDHIDNTKDNNMWYNLQWVTSEFNTIKYYAESYGKEKTLSSLTKYEWKYVGFLFNAGLEYKCICENLGLTVSSPDTLWDGLSGRRLSSITGFKKGDFIKRKHPTTKLGLHDVVDIIEDRLINKKSLKFISSERGIAESMISRFCKGSRQPEALKIFKEKHEDFIK